MDGKQRKGLSLACLLLGLLSLGLLLLLHTLIRLHTSFIYLFTFEVAVVGMFYYVSACPLWAAPSLFKHFVLSALFFSYSNSLPSLPCVCIRNRVRILVYFYTTSLSLSHENSSNSFLSIFSFSSGKNEFFQQRRILSLSPCLFPTFIVSPLLACLQLGMRSSPLSLSLSHSLSSKRACALFGLM